MYLIPGTSVPCVQVFLTRTTTIKIQTASSLQGSLPLSFYSHPPSLTPDAISLKSCFYIFKWLGGNIYRFHDAWKSVKFKIQCPSKILVGCSQTHSFTYCLCLLLDYDSRLEILLQTLYDLQSWKHLLSGCSQKKFAGPNINCHI